ncbi:phosphonoacetaldehyde reductase [Paenibacillus sp. IHBB 10380]|uniref:phosphonoacetaldehyde reductase n=1 Tax=Paenibacillus sp. IHBB 10380 TaxID=1566358 RepID=UPI0005CFB0B7|nr:phosphonoacetaldehyde reductase [Paenibacillus sp. IHBB 10380]AJS60366.1 hypothetical protein UB51_20085 [Paenibacillus sp. IHBB 10380]
MNKFNYYNPVQVTFGQGSFTQLNEVVGDRKVLLLTSKGFTKRGTVEQLKQQINSDIIIIDSIAPNPTIDELSFYYEKIIHQHFDVIVALGGGSVIDTAKVLSVYQESQSSFEPLKRLIKEGTEFEYKLRPIIAIPTTSGTSSEITPWATVWDNVNKKKYSLQLKDLWCELAIYDPLLTLSLSKELTIQTGLDALSHSFESLWNKNANYLSRDHAIQAAKEIIEVLPKLINDLSNIALRERLMYASLKAGLAFSNTQTAIAHAISYELTLRKEIPHGIACSITLPSIIKSIYGQEKNLDRALTEILGPLNENRLILLFNKLEVSLLFSNYGIQKEDLIKIKNGLVEIQRAQNSLVNTEVLFNELSSNISTLQ